MSDDRGQAVHDYVVVAFSEDSTKWLLPTPRHVRMARPDQDGKYSVTGFPPGEYLIAVEQELDMESAYDPETLERLRSKAVAARLGGWGKEGREPAIGPPIDARS